MATNQQVSAYGANCKQAPQPWHAVFAVRLFTGAFGLLRPTQIYEDLDPSFFTKDEDENEHEDEVSIGATRHFVRDTEHRVNERGRLTEG